MPPSLPEFHSSSLGRRSQRQHGSSELARHEGNFRTGAEEPLSLNELLALLSSAGAGARTREDAIACYLSGAEGWREAMKLLGGTFAEASEGLRERKDD